MPFRLVLALKLHHHGDLGAVGQHVVGEDAVDFHAVDQGLLHAAFVVSRVVNGDVQLLAAEGLLHGEAVPLGGDGGGDDQAFGGGTQAQDAFHAADHHGGGGAGQPMHMGAAMLGRLVTLDELGVDVGFALTQVGLVVEGSGAALLEVLEGAAAVTHEGLGQDDPALSLAEDAAVLLGGGVEQLHQRAVEVMLLVAGSHDFHAVAGVQLLVHGLQSGLGLLLGGQLGDDGPGLGIQPHGALLVLLAADDEALFGIAAAETVVLPEMLVDELLLLGGLFTQVGAVLFVFGGVGHQLVQDVHGQVQLHGHEGGFAGSTQAQAVVPVGMEASGHTMHAQVVHGEVDGALEVIQHGAFAMGGVGNDLVHEVDVAGLGNVLIHGGEEPQGVVGTVAGVRGGADVAFVLGRILVAGIVGELHQGQAAAVMHLGRQHMHQATLGHFGIQMDDALDVLHGVAIAQTIALAAVDQGRGTAPHEGDEALEGVPGVDHGVEVAIGGVHLQGAQLAVPVGDQLLQLGIHLGLHVSIGIQQRTGSGGTLHAQHEGDGLGLARLQLQHGVQGAAGVAVEAQLVAQIAVDHSLGVVEAVAPQEAFAAAAVALHGAASQAEEALGAVFSILAHVAILVDVLEDEIIVEGGGGDELGVLEVHQILLVVGFGGEFAVAQGRDLAGLVGLVGHLNAPHLVGSALGHVIQHLGSDTGVFALDLGVGGAVAGDGLVLLQGLLHRTPGSRPVVAGLVVAQVDVAARLVELVEGIADDTASGAGLHEAVAASVLGHDGTIFRIAQVVGPGHGGTGIGNDVLAGFVVKIAVLHEGCLLDGSVFSKTF